MCQKCLDLVKKYFPRISTNNRSTLLWECTCFPFGDPIEHLEPQLKAIANRRKKDGFRRNWLNREVARADMEMHIAMKKGGRKCKKKQS